MSSLPSGFRRASEIERRNVAWLWRNRIPLADNTAISGDGGAGKSTLTHSIIARCTRGQLHQLPGGSDLIEPRGAVVLSVEEDAEAVVMPRLAAMGSDLGRVLIYSDGSDEAPAITLPSRVDQLTAAVEAVDAAMVMVDTGTALLDPGLKSNAPENVRAYYRSLSRIARERRLSVITICHLNKSPGGSARQRVSGAADWVNVPRSVLVMGPPPGEDALETGERLVAIVKANLIGGRLPDAVAMRLVPGEDDPSIGVVAWAGERAGVRASDLTEEVDAEERDARADAADELRQMLAAGPVEGKKVDAELRKRYSASTIRRARDKLGITRKAGNVFQAELHGPHMWRLPGTEAQPPVSLNGASGTSVAPDPASDSTEHTHAPKTVFAREHLSAEDQERWEAMADVRDA